MSSPSLQLNMVDDLVDDPFQIFSTKNVSIDRLKRWRQSTLVLNSYRRFRYTLDLRKEEEKEKLRRKIRANFEAIRAGIIARHNNDAKPIVGSSENQNSFYIAIEEDEAHGMRNTVWNQEGALEWIFVITNFFLELPSVILDQLSSVHKPEYALLAMLISFAALLICVVELIYRGKKEKVTWRWRGKLPWFYYPSENYMPFGTFKDIIGSVCAFFQCIVTIINYDFCHRHAGIPIKVSVWPIIFALGLLFSKLIKNTERRVIL